MQLIVGKSISKIGIGHIMQRIMTSLSNSKWSSRMGMGRKSTEMRRRTRRMGRRRKEKGIKGSGEVGEEEDGKKEKG